ncbi:cation/H(+) antiporter 18-like, partial [Trifolium medium]|nr:cation/H(+) antiporter 18-like [Trifolium medium]
LGGTCHVSASNVSYCVSVLFFGGGDDREALAYGARMAEHPDIKLVVIRFLVETNILGEITRVDVGESSSGKSISEDEEFLAEFKLKTASDESVIYEEKIVKDAAETVAAIREFNSCNLFLVGLRPTGELACALERSDCLELGPVGGLLASQDCPTTASVLAMQQYPNGVPTNSGPVMEEHSHEGDTESA